MDFNRRQLLTGTAAVTGAMLLGAPAILAQAKPRVVVIGGGAGGATAAKYIAKDSAGAIAVTLVEPNAKYQTCFHSNLYLGGVRDYASITHEYTALAKINGLEIARDSARMIDRDKKEVVLAGGRRLPYDRLVVSPGIDLKYDSVPGWSQAAEEAMPHAWKPGAQTLLLRKRLDAVPNGGVIVMIAPPNPYRCPPGPYERISMIAHVLKQKNPTAKILIADPKDNFSKRALFEEGWQKHYDGMVSWIGPDFGGGNVEVRPETMEVVIDGEATKVDACNVIPGQMAGKIAALAGVTDDSGWAPVHADTMKSKLDENIWVLGDSSAQGDMPKSGFSANSQAKVAAMTIRGELTGSKVFPAKYSNTCWSLIAPEDGVKVGASYEPTPDKIASVDSFVSQTGEDAALRKATYEESLGWYTGITADIFG